MSNYAPRSRQFGRRSFSSNSSRGSRPQFARSSRPRSKSNNIDISRFINTNAVLEEVVPYASTHRFADFEIDERIKHNIISKGYETPTPIQDQAIPHVLEGRDVVGIANTGTGKTGAFLIPLLNKVVKDRSQRVLIMVPTRELAQQIDDEFKTFARGSGFSSVCVVGGANINPQLRTLRSDPYFVIGTPGRLKDVMERGALNLSKFQTVVLDEADRMLDMGFIADMRFILAKMQPERHTLFFSATLSRDIEKLIGEFLNNPVRVSVKVGETSKSVHQDIVHVTKDTKLDALCDLLIQPDFNKVLVFGRTKHGVEKLAQLLQKRGIKAESIHGNKTQGKRQRALDLFKRDHVQVLVATDVAARGIDVASVSHVINYDVPTTYEDYVHRIGRTGRAGKIGKALTFVE